MVTLCKQAERILRKNNKSVLQGKRALYIFKDLVLCNGRKHHAVLRKAAVEMT